MKGFFGKLLVGGMIASVFTWCAAPITSLAAEEGIWVETKYTEYDQDHKVQTSWVKEYDNRGNNTKYTDMYGGELNGYVVYEYDSKSRMSRLSSYAADGHCEIYDDYYYDENDNLIRQTSYGEFGTKYEYDENNNLIKRYSYDDRPEFDDNGKYTTVYEYDSKGNMTRETYYYDGQKGTDIVMEYDANSNMIKKTLDSNVSEYTYNADGNVTKELDYNNGELYLTTEYEYDANGNQTKETLTFSGETSSKSVFTYEYDERGNKTKITRASGYGYVYQTVENTYDENNNLLKEVFHDSEKIWKTIEHEYKYIDLKNMDPSGSPLFIEGKDCSWNEANGKFYWYENGKKQGTYDDPQGVVGDGTVRGREIYDAGSDGWYWLDANAYGAKAIGKEVWMPYIYQDEKTFSDERIDAISKESDPGMEALVASYIREGKGKWVRYDNNGKMLKGWVDITGELAAVYPDQAGNRYYYDTRTGLMAKGWVKINGTDYHFDEITGVLK